MRLNGKKLLLVSPRPTTLENLREVVETEGGHPFCARNASYALWFLKSEVFHGIVLDSELDSSQWDTLEHQLSKKEFSKVPLLILADPRITDQLRKLARLRAAGVLRRPLVREEILKELETHSLKSRPTRSSHDSRVIKCFVAAMRKLCKDSLNYIPQIGKIQIKSPDEIPDYGLISWQFSTPDKKGTLSWSVDTMFISQLAKAWGEESLLQEHDPWYLEEFLKKLDKKIQETAKDFQKAVDLRIEFQNPRYLIAPKTGVSHIDKEQTLRVSIQHLGSGCHLEVSMIPLPEAEKSKISPQDQHPGVSRQKAPEPLSLGKNSSIPEKENPEEDSLNDILEIE